MPDNPRVPAPAMPGVDLDALEAIEREATPGPWRRAMTGYSVRSDAPLYPNRTDIVCTANYRLDRDEKLFAQWVNDADLIPAARNALPALIAELRDLRRLYANVLAGAERRRTLVAEARALADAATAAPWDVGSEVSEVLERVSDDWRLAPTVIADCYSDDGPGDYDVATANAAFIARARTLLPEAVTELAALDDLLPAPTGGHGP